MITPMDEYLFDLRGYTVIPNALDPDHIRAMNAWIDALPLLAMSQWVGNVYVHTYGGIDGMNLQDIIEGGEIFERLIDHPAWIEQVRHYLGPSTKPYINEIFINVRGPSGYIGVQSVVLERRGKSTWFMNLLNLYLIIGLTIRQSQ